MLGHGDYKTFAICAVLAALKERIVVETRWSSVRTITVRNLKKNALDARRKICEAAVERQHEYGTSTRYLPR
jgi:hypothetical protein